MTPPRHAPVQSPRTHRRLRAFVASSLATLLVLASAEGAIRVLAPSHVASLRILDLLWTRGMEEGYLLDEEEFLLGQGRHTGTQTRLPNHALAPDLREAGGYHVGYDASGLRNPGTGTTGPGSPYRVLCLGDSVTYGSGVESGDTYCAQLGSRIEAARPHLRVEVVNAGLPGYAAAHGYDLYRTRLQTSAFDLAVVAYGFNDHRLEGLRDAFEGDRDPAGSSPWSRIVGSSALLMTLRSRFEEAATGAPRPLNLEVGDDPIATDPSSFLQTLRELQGALRADGAAVVFLCTEPSLGYLPRFDGYVAAYRELAQDGHDVVFARDSYAGHPRRSQVRTWFAEAPNWTDELEPFAAAGAARDRALPFHEFHVDIVHPNRAGHQAVADALYETVAGNAGLEPRQTETPWALQGRVSSPGFDGDIGVVVTPTADGFGWPWWEVYPFSPGAEQAPPGMEIARAHVTGDGTYRIEELRYEAAFVFAYAPADVFPPTADSWIGRAAVNPVRGARAGGGSVDIVLRPLERVDFTRAVAHVSGESDESAGVLAEVAALSGIEQRPRPPGSMDDLAAAMPSGCAFLDADGDGDDDLFAPVLAAGGLGGLWINGGAGQFTRGPIIPVEVGLGAPMGVASADYDGDGHADLLVGGTQRSVLLHNDGGASFRVDDSLDVPAQGFASQPAFVDLDADGDLDIVIARLIQTDPWGLPHPQHRRTPTDTGIGSTTHGYPKPTPLAYLQQDSSFTLESGYLLAPRPASASGLAAFPLRNGLTVLVAATPVMSRPWVCGADGCGVGGVEGLSLFGETVGGLAPGDYDNDGDLDLLATYWRLEATRLLRQGDGTDAAVAFSDVTVDAGLDQVSATPGFFGVLFADLDLDGRLDLVLAGGDSAPDMARPGRRALAGSRVLLGRPEGTFEDISDRVGGAWGEPVSGRGICASDLDEDGDVDFAMVQNDGELLVWRNDLRRAGRWLEVKLVGRPPATSAMGAEVAVTVAGETLHRWVVAGGGYLSQSSDTLHFGLGDSSVVRTLEVTWPDGGVTRMSDVRVDQRIVIQR